jgi:hypothetical protein
MPESSIGFPTRLRPSDREGEWPVWGNTCRFAAPQAPATERRKRSFSARMRNLPSIAADRDKAQMLGAHLGHLQIVKVALDTPQPGLIRRVG